MVELLVVIAVIAILLGIFLPAYVGVMKEFLRRTCQDNLGHIGKALMSYGPSEWNRGAGGAGCLPALSGPKPEDDNTNKGNWYSWGANHGNTNSLWLLVQGNFAAPDNFVCPEARRALGHKPAHYTKRADGTGEDDGHFTWTTCSYSYISQVGYYYRKIPANAATETYAVGGSCLQTIDTRIKKVLLGDRNPRMQDGLSASGEAAGRNSKNHGREGQNFYLLNQQTLWVEDMRGAKNGDTMTMNDKRLDDDPYSPVDDANFTSGIPSNSSDSFLLQ